MTRNIALLSAVFVLSAASASGQVVINEIMQSNVDCIMDDINEFPDSWVELYNAGPAPVDLGQYSLGVSTDASAAYRLPSATLAPGAHRLVYCDKVADGWHTPFRLESGKGCELYLFANGSVADALPSGMKKQPAPNIAYGRATDGADSWGYQLTPTPGAANCGQTCTNKDILGQPVFSTPGRVLTGATTLSIALSLPPDSPPGTQMRYTTDGSEPTTQSPLYTNPIAIIESTVLRAKLFCPGKLSPLSATQSYIMLDHSTDLPIVALTTDERYLYDDAIGIYTMGNSGMPNFNHDWRRPMNIELFDGNPLQSSLNQAGEFRITGGATRSYPLKSLGIYANKRFGEKRLEHEFFPDQRPGQTQFKSLMLRNAGNDYYDLYLRDALIQKHMARYVDIDWQASRPAIVFINGEYKGMLYIRERSNEDNIFTNYNGLEDIHMTENWWEQKEGEWSVWQDFYNFYHEDGHTYSEYSERMDIEEFMNVMILNLFFCNLDFPANNIVWWRPQADGGRWRIIVKDTDYGLGLYDRPADYKVLEWLYTPGYDGNWANSPDATLLFRQLMEQERFRGEFIDRFAVYMGDFMNLDCMWQQTWQPMYECVLAERPYHLLRNETHIPDYEQETERVRQWLLQRVEQMYLQLADFYQLGAPKPLTISSSAASGVMFNGVALAHSDFGGQFFAGRPITLTAPTTARWTISCRYPDGVKTTDVHGPVCTFTIADNCEGVAIEVAISGEQPTLAGDVNFDGKVSVADYNRLCRMVCTATVFDASRPQHQAADLDHNQHLEQADVDLLARMLTAVEER